MSRTRIVFGRITFLLKRFKPFNNSCARYDFVAGFTRNSVSTRRSAALRRRLSWKSSTGRVRSSPGPVIWSPPHVVYSQRISTGCVLYKRLTFPSISHNGLVLGTFIRGWGAYAMKTIAWGFAIFTNSTCSRSVRRNLTHATRTSYLHVKYGNQRRRIREAPTVIGSQHVSDLQSDIRVRGRCDVRIQCAAEQRRHYECEYAPPADQMFDGSHSVSTRNIRQQCHSDNPKNSRRPRSER